MPPLRTLQAPFLFEVVTMECTTNHRRRRAKTRASMPSFEKEEIMPGYLKGYESHGDRDPRAANLAWFKHAQFGMMICFSPASQVGTQGWFQANPTWTSWHNRNASLKPREYRKYLKDKFEPQLLDPAAQQLVDAFTGKTFDADKITDLAVAAGMKYITFTSQHVLGRMFMFDTTTSPLCSAKLAPKRDFVAELAKACDKRHLGLFLYVMPPYSEPIMQARIRRMLTELLTQNGPIAGIWFDGIWEAYRRPQSFNVDEVSQTYALVRKLQPHCLVSFKTGYTGEEDFLAPEWHQCTYDKDGVPDIKGDPPSRVKALWKDTLRYKPVEISSTMIHGDEWFHIPDGKHKTADQVVEQFRYARSHKLTFLMNIGLLGDGSIHPEDEKTLREVGRRLSESKKRKKMLK